METNQPEEKVRAASAAVSQTVQRAVDTPAGRVVKEFSEAGERNSAIEPINSTVRSLLLTGAGLAIATSMIMQITGRKHESLFFGQWVATLMSIGLWYQIVKGQQTPRLPNTR